VSIFPNIGSAKIVKVKEETSLDKIKNLDYLSGAKE
jgi:hypothetical protein